MLQIEKPNHGSVLRRENPWLLPPSAGAGAAASAAAGDPDGL